MTKKEKQDTETVKCVKLSEISIDKVSILSSGKLEVHRSSCVGIRVTKLILAMLTVTLEKSLSHRILKLRKV